MDKKALTTWLANLGKDRTWLAEQIGSVKGTVDQWFSKGFPEWAEKSIERLMNPPGTETAGLEVTFTARQFERIEEARALVGARSRKEFYEMAITELTDDILAREKQEEQKHQADQPPAASPIPRTTRYSAGTEGLVERSTHGMNETASLSQAHRQKVLKRMTDRNQQAGHAARVKGEDLSTGS